MTRYHVPGVAVGIHWQGREHVRGFGVTNADHPLPVDADTLFRIGSTTKTFTGHGYHAPGRAGQGRSRSAGAHAICRTWPSPTRRPPEA